MTVQIKRTSVGTVPTSLLGGELCLDYLNGKLYFQDTNGVIQYIPATLANLQALIANQSPRYDIAALLNVSQSARLRQNIGVPPTQRISGAVNLDVQLSLWKDFEFLGAYTATSPDASTGAVPDGWRTGHFHNRGNGSITTANFVGTIAVPNGAYLDGIQNGTKTLAYGQKGYLIWDAQATPQATWRWVWIDRQPLLLAGTYTSVASFDFAMPAGYQSFDINISNVALSASGAGLGCRLSADSGNTFRSGASDYTYQFDQGTGSTANAGSGNSNFMQLGGGETNSATYQTSRATKIQGSIDAKYGTALTITSFVNATPAGGVWVITSSQNETVGGGAALITPNYIRFLPNSGTFSCTASIKGIPST